MKRLLLLLLLVPLLANAGLFGFAGGAIILQNAAPATVPDCTTAPTTLSACVVLLDSATSGHYVLLVNYQYSSMVAANIVISMSPAAGGMLAYNGVETLVVSLGTFTPVVGGKQVSSLRPAGGSRMSGF